MHVAQRLLDRGEQVMGIDNVNSYYDPALKRARLAQLIENPGFRFCEGDLTDRTWTEATLKRGTPLRIIHLAAQAGVRYSLENPASYIDSNLVGFSNILESCRHQGTIHLVYASSSSVYGSNGVLPFTVEHRTDEPVSLYAATKKANELMAYTYAHLYGIPATGLRFFTVYGPWGRPDMAYYSFTRKILAGEEIPVFNGGALSRDFTYIDDIVDGVVAVLDRPPEHNALTAHDPPHRLLNIGASAPTSLMEFIKTLERAIGTEARLKMLPMQAGDVPATYADVSALQRLTGTAPRISLEAGLQQFVAWYRWYHAKL
jgi:UDP-glucuronate 4-epimerase